MGQIKCGPEGTIITILWVQEFGKKVPIVKYLSCLVLINMSYIDDDTAVFLSDQQLAQR